MKNAPFPEALALVIYVGTVLTREAWAAQPALGVEGGGLPGKEPSALVLPAPALTEPPTPLPPGHFTASPQEAERFIGGKVNTIIPGPLTRRFWRCKYTSRERRGARRTPL